MNCILTWKTLAEAFMAGLGVGKPVAWEPAGAAAIQALARGKVNLEEVA